MKKMKLKWLTQLLLTSLLTIAFACSDEETYDVEEPKIIELISPAPCEACAFGDTIFLKAKLSDNENLKGFKLNVHHNFDHHTHGNHKEVCELNPQLSTSEIAATNPFLQNWSANLPKASEVSVDTFFVLPKLNAENDLPFTGGDYHVLLYVTDDGGNQSFTSVSIKLIE